MENNNNKKLPGNYIAGFTDGEGCFCLKFRRDVRRERKNSPTYFYWSAEFAIAIRNDDVEILKKIKNTLKCGRISFSRENARYSVNKIEDLMHIIIPFFRKNRLYAKKRFDFELWSRAVEIIFNKTRIQRGAKKGKRGFEAIKWNNEEWEELMDIRRKMRQFKSKRPSGYKYDPLYSKGRVS